MVRSCACRIARSLGGAAAAQWPRFCRVARQRRRRKSLKASVFCRSGCGSPPCARTCPAGYAGARGCQPLASGGPARRMCRAIRPPRAPGGGPVGRMRAADDQDGRASGGASGGGPARALRAMGGASLRRPFCVPGAMEDSVTATWRARLSPSTCRRLQGIKCSQLFPDMATLSGRDTERGEVFSWDWDFHGEATLELRWQ